MGSFPETSIDPALSNEKLGSLHVRLSKTVDLGFCIPRFGFLIPDSWFLSVELEFQIPIVSKSPDWPDSLSYILDSKAQNYGIHKKRFSKLQNPEKAIPFEIEGLWEVFITAIGSIITQLILSLIRREKMYLVE